MNQNELKYFSNEEKKFGDITFLSLPFLLKALFIKIRRKTWGKLRDRRSRLIWTAKEVSDAHGPAANVRDYRERQAIRFALAGAIKNKVVSACEIGCGYGRLTMVLEEFASKVVGFEREAYLVDIGRPLLPAVDFVRVDSLAKLSGLGKGPFGLVMTCTVLQHLTDIFCREVLEEIKAIAPKGYVLLVEKTEAVSVTANTEDGNSFISRARDVERYAEWMKPYKLISVAKRTIEPTYYISNVGSIMLFRSPSLD